EEEMDSKMDQYEIMEQIGRGAFGAAILVNHKLERKKYVLKKIRLARQTERCRKSAHQEVALQHKPSFFMALIARVHHPYIVEFKEAWVEKGCYVCIVTGYCEGGDMAELMKKANGQYFPEEKLLKWFSQLLLAVEYLHSNFVLHRDLKCSNIFLTKDQDVRLGDFGLAKTLKADDLASSVVGTPNYMCPELLADIPYGFKSDIWSLGCCMYEMTAHRPAFKAFDMAGLISKINRSSIGPIPPCYSPFLKTIIKSMLRKNPEHRSTASELLKHPYLLPYVMQYRPSYIPPAAAVSPEKPLPRPRESRRSMAESQSSNSSCSDRESLKNVRWTNDAERGSIELLPEINEVNETGKKPEKNESKPPKTIKNIMMALKEARIRENTSPSTGSNGGKNANDKPSPESFDDNGNDVDTKSCKHCSPPPLASSPAPVSEAEPENKEKTVEAEDPLAEEVVNATSPDSPEPGEHQKNDATPSSSAPPAAAAAKEELLDVNSFRQRAEALEGLLELSADLLQHNRLEELAVVLKPFGKEKVSPRDTAIWLAKSL
ncbi:hypothetical protein M569_05383, partial [Genlisea aurea]